MRCAWLLRVADLSVAARMVWAVNGGAAEAAHVTAMGWYRSLCSTAVALMAAVACVVTGICLAESQRMSSMGHGGVR